MAICAEGSMGSGAVVGLPPLMEARSRPKGISGKPGAGTTFHFALVRSGSQGASQKRTSPQMTFRPK
jgi:hypothetical protein